MTNHGGTLDEEKLGPFSLSSFVQPILGLLLLVWHRYVILPE